MRDEGSIELLKAKIFSTNTSEYFEEVYSSYTHGNYRSAVVMLWSVVVLDVVQKVQSLKDSYDDKAAVSILSEIATMNSNDRKSSAWELSIIKSVCTLTDLIEDSEYTNLEYLQQQRHLSAHPIIHSGVKLYVPNKDTTRALIRNALESILIKPPVYTHRILNTILTDLAENGDGFTELKELKPYIQYKYLNRITVESKLKLFEKFWKLTMHLDNVECNKNRFQNLRFLILLALDIPIEVERAIENKPDFYSKIKNEENFTDPLINFISRMPRAYTLLNAETRILVDLAIEKRTEFRIVSTYTKSSMQEHYDYLERIFTTEPCTDYLRPQLWEMLYERSDSAEMEQNCIRSMSLYYSQSRNFEEANHAMTNVMKFIDKFNIESFKYLLDKAEGNNQTYGRSGALKDYKVVKEKILALDDNFDFASYPRFNATTTREGIA